MALKKLIDWTIVQRIEKLKSTEGLGDANGGLWKKWPWKSPDHFKLMSDLVLKANYSIQDFNALIEDGFSPNPKDVVFLIVLAIWIKESYWQIKSNCLSENVCHAFQFSKEAELEEAQNYLKAVRSIVVAHPLNTNKHNDYGFGKDNRICIDIRGKSLTDSFPGASIYRITPSGFKPTDSVKNDDIALMTCSREADQNNKLHFERCCMNMIDVRNAAQSYIDALFELDRFLGKAKKKDFDWD